MGIDKIKSYLYTISQSNYALFWLLLVKTVAILTVGHMNIVGHGNKWFHSNPHMPKHTCIYNNYVPSMM